MVSWDDRTPLVQRRDQVSANPEPSPDHSALPGTGVHVGSASPGRRNIPSDLPSAIAYNW